MNQQKKQRFGQVAKVRPEAKEAYVKYHEKVWPKVLERIKKCNIHNYSIFLKDDYLSALPFRLAVSLRVSFQF